LSCTNASWKKDGRIEAPGSSWDAHPASTRRRGRHHQDLVQDEVRQRQLLDVWIAHHDAETEALAVLLRQRQRGLPVRIGIEPAGSLLQLTPGRANVELLPQRKPSKGFDLLFHVKTAKRVAAEVARYVGHEAHSEVRHGIADGVVAITTQSPAALLPARIEETAPGTGGP
jgi:hypothetical protein